MFQLKQINEIIDKALKDLAINCEPKNLYEPIKYILSIGGKRIRPAMALMACNLFSDNLDDALFPAIGIEVFHNFTLMHDDIMDKSPVRRNYPTVHTKWGMNTAILSGDAMCVLAYQLMQKTKPAILPKILETFTKTAIEVCEGQQYDMDFETRMNVSEEEYIRMITLKTSVLLACSFKIGAIAGRAGIADQENLYEFGKNLGIAFQLQDDLLDTYGNQAVFGKKIGNDIITNKKTFLFVKALKEGSVKQKKELKELYSKENSDEEKVKRVTTIFNELDIKAKTEILINECFEKAASALNKVEIEENRKVEIIYFTNLLKKRDQ